jgi:hypothetical protein
MMAYLAVPVRGGRWLKELCECFEAPTWLLAVVIDPSWVTHTG